MRTFLIVIAILLVGFVAIFLLNGCNTLIAIDRAGCATERSIEITKTEGEPDQTVVRSQRVCADRTPATGTNRAKSNENRL